MKLFQVVLRTPDKVVFEGEISSLTITQSDGYTTFLAGFENSFGTFVSGVQKLVDEKNVQTSFVTENGVFVVENGTLTLNSALIVQGDDPVSVLGQIESEREERKLKHERSRKEYSKSKMEMAKSLLGVDDEEDE
ncbi:MAG: hypothetical protein IJ226_04295 [Clostridia bacterium]|nr:hypothetical protein [Clostridia bacterium]